MPPAVGSDPLPSTSDNDSADNKSDRKDKPVLESPVDEREPEYAGSEIHILHPQNLGWTQPMSSPVSSPLCVSPLCVCRCSVRGECFYSGCLCKLFTGESGVCLSCQHPNLYHQVKPHRSDVLLLAAESSRQKQLFTKRKQREQREQELKRAELMKHPPPIIQNTYPCTVQGCDCAKFIAPTSYSQQAAHHHSSSNNSSIYSEPTSARGASSHSQESLAGTETGWSSLTTQTAAVSTTRSSLSLSVDVLSVPSTAASLPSPSSSNAFASANNAHLLPRLCKKCKHAEMYHIRDEAEEKKKAKSSSKSSKKQ